MSFHLGGHKPKLVRKAPRFSLKQRLLVLGGGAAFVLAGMFKLNHGQLAWRNYFGETVYSPSLVMLGLVFVVLALIPASWLSWLVRPLSGPP